MLALLPMSQAKLRVKQFGKLALGLGSGAADPLALLTQCALRLGHANRSDCELRWPIHDFECRAAALGVNAEPIIRAKLSNNPTGLSASSGARSQAAAGATALPPWRRGPLRRVSPAKQFALLATRQAAIDADRS